MKHAYLRQHEQSQVALMVRHRVNVRSPSDDLCVAKEVEAKDATVADGAPYLEQRVGDDDLKSTVWVCITYLNKQAPHDREQGETTGGNIDCQKSHDNIELLRI